MKIKNNQSLIDIAIREFGSIEAMFDLAVQNNIVLDQYFNETNNEITVKGIPIIDDKMVQYYRVNDIHPATNCVKPDVHQQPKRGINYMMINKNFIVKSN
ncbi:hypothetical protein N9251_00675 [Gammaproteobacteria bacterium]|nr:hypothetical protein [Gammaproteobacteria bacterium]